MAVVDLQGMSAVQFAHLLQKVIRHDLQPGQVEHSPDIGVTFCQRRPGLDTLPVPNAHDMAAPAAIAEPPCSYRIDILLGITLMDSHNPGNRSQQRRPRWSR